MPDWLWVLALFLMLTFGYCIGYATGSYKNDPDKAPTEQAYIREAEINAAVWKDVEIRKEELACQANKEIALRKVELEQQNAIERYKIAAAELKNQNETNQQKEESDGNML